MSHTISRSAAVRATPSVKNDDGPARFAGKTAHLHVDEDGINAAPPSAKPMTRTLIIDDDGAFARAVGRILCDYDPIIETDPASALRRIVRGEWFDVIVCDVNMPDLPGLEILAFVRALPEQPVFIMVSASEVAKTSGADGALLKPFTAPTLLDLVGKLRDEKSHAVTRPLPCLGDL